MNDIPEKIIDYTSCVLFLLAFGLLFWRTQSNTGDSKKIAIHHKDGTKTVITCSIDKTIVDCGSENITLWTTSGDIDVRHGSSPIPKSSNE